MQKFMIGLGIGLLTGAGGLILWSNAGLPVPSNSPETLQTESAGSATNFAADLDTREKIPLTLEVVDQPDDTNATNPTDLVSLEVTLTKAEITLRDSTVSGAASADLPRTEILNLRQPTIDLLSLRGSQLPIQLGLTELAVGTYRDLRLTIGSIKGKTSTGATIDIPVNQDDAIITIPTQFSWNTAETGVTLQINLDSFASLHQAETTYQFTPIVQGVLENGLVRP